MIFAPWAARKIFLAGEEYFLRDTANDAPEATPRTTNKTFYKHFDLERNKNYGNEGKGSREAAEVYEE